MADAHISGFAKVQAGWTGTLTATVGAASVAVTPASMRDGYESAASVVLRLVRDCTEQLGGTWAAYPNANGTITVESSLSFSLAGTSLTATRTGLATYSAAYTHTGTAHPNGVYPSALSFDGQPNTRRAARVSSDGSVGLPSIWDATGHAANIVDTWASVRSAEASLLPEGGLLTADLWCSDFMCGRFVITGLSVSPSTRDMGHWSIDLTLKATA